MPQQQWIWWYVFRNGFYTRPLSPSQCWKETFSTEGALSKLPMNYNNQSQSHPPSLLSSKQALDWSESTSNDLQWPPMTSNDHWRTNQSDQRFQHFYLTPTRLLPDFFSTSDPDLPDNGNTLLVGSWLWHNISNMSLNHENAVIKLSPHYFLQHRSTTKPRNMIRLESNKTEETLLNHLDWRKRTKELSCYGV